MKKARHSPPAFDVWTRLVRAADTARGAIEGDLKINGFPPLSWYDVLLELDRKNGTPMRLFELEKNLLLTQYNLSRLIDRIDKAGYVEKRQAEDDRRGYEVSITETGRQLLNRMWPVYRASVERHVGDAISPQDIPAIIPILEKLYRKDDPTGE